MENLHEMGFRIREKKVKTAKLVAGIVAGVLVTGALVLAGARIDGLERQVAQAKAQAQTEARTDTVMIGLKRAVLQDGDVVLRIGVVGGTENPESRVQKPESRVGGEVKSQKLEAKSQNDGGER